MAWKNGDGDGNGNGNGADKMSVQWRWRMGKWSGVFFFFFGMKIMSACQSQILCIRNMFLVLVFCFLVLFVVILYSKNFAFH